MRDRTVAETLVEVDREYGVDPQDCPFCGGRGGMHLPLTRVDGKVTRCQVGDVRELARCLREEEDARDERREYAP